MSYGQQRSMEDAEPKAAVTAAPVGLIGLFALLFYGAAVYVNGHAGGFDARVYQPYPSYAMVDSLQIVDPAEDMRRKGKLIYNANCAVCHQPNGMGVPGDKPPLAGSEWVLNPSPHRIIRGVLNGLTGPITVSGKPFNNTMVPWKATLNDDEIANVMTFIRQNKEWGNNAPAVTAQQVKSIRDKVADRASAFTAAELEKLPEDK